MKCVHCDREAPEHHNYCTWDCHVDHARKLGGPVFCPNNLPITTLRFDGALLEHEEADHPDYKFPLVSVYVDPPPLEEGEDEYGPRSDAFIYTDGSVALTIYESCYTIWAVSSGECYERRKLTPESLEKLQAYARPIQEAKEKHKQYGERRVDPSYILEDVRAPANGKD